MHHSPTSISPSDTTFLQSTEWEAVCAREGKKTLRVAGFLCRETVFPGAGKYWYIARGPHFANDVEMREKLPAILDEAKKQSIRWLRIEPHDHVEMKKLEEFFNQQKIQNPKSEFSNKSENQRSEQSESFSFLISSFFKNLSFGFNTLTAQNDTQLRKAPHDMQPREMFAVDLSPSEEELFKNMKPKTRYNIRLAEKHEVNISFENNIDLLKTFVKLVRETAKRAGIRPHTSEHYRAIIETLPAESWTFGIATYQEKVVSMSLLVFHNGVTLYLHGGSTQKYKEVMAPQLLHWKGMRESKKRGMRWYDFGGVDWSGHKESWSGITRFKIGFAPKTHPRSFPGTFDLILDKYRYRLYQLLQFSRAVHRWFHRVVLKHLFILAFILLLLGGAAFGGTFLAEKNVATHAAFIADIHRCSAHGDTSRLDVGLQNFADAVRDAEVADVIILGDVSNSDDKDCRTTYREDREMVDIILQSSGARLHYALGANDIESTIDSESSWLAFSGYNEPYFSVDLRGAKLLVLDTVLGGWSMREECENDQTCSDYESQRLYFKDIYEDPVKRKTYQKENNVTKEDIFTEYNKYKSLVKREKTMINQTRSTNKREQGFLSQEETLWLGRELENVNDGMIIVASHHPLFLYQNGDSEVSVDGREKALDLLSFASRSGRSVKLFSGNIHEWREDFSGGLSYQSIGSFDKDGSWALATWYLDGRFSVEKK